MTHNSDNQTRRKKKSNNMLNNCHQGTTSKITIFDDKTNNSIKRFFRRENRTKTHLQRLFKQREHRKRLNHQRRKVVVYGITCRKFYIGSTIRSLNAPVTKVLQQCTGGDTSIGTNLDIQVIGLIFMK